MFLSKAYAQDGEGVTAAMMVAPESGVEHGGNFPPFDSTYFGSHLFWLALSFAVFYFLMARFIIPRIGSLIEMRRDRIASDLERAGRLKLESDAAIELYEQQLKEARANAHMLARTAMDEAKATSESERSAAEAALAHRLAQAESQINRLHEQAMQHVEDIATQTAQAILLSLIGHKLDEVALKDAVKVAAQDR